MLGWSRRCLFFSTPFFLPRGIRAAGEGTRHGLSRLLPPLVCMLLTFALATFARLLEFPFWDTPSFQLNEEFLLATHDAYHWIAGAEGFEFGAGHPMSELARILGQWTSYPPAVVGFWLPAFMGGLLAVAVFLWGWGLGRPYAGMAAGVLTSLSPAFFARTLLGFYDTDLVVLLFAILLGLIPALWLTPWLAGLPETLWAFLARKRDSTAQPEANAGRPPSVFFALFPPWRFGANARTPGVLCFSSAEFERSTLTPAWLLLLILSGLFGHSMQDWHSLFPYLVRFSALVPPLLILVFGPRGGRATLLAGALCHVFPLLLGWPGTVAGFLYACALMLTRHTPGSVYDLPVDPAAARAEKRPPPLSLCWRLYPPSFEFRRGLARNRTTLILLWAAVLFLVIDSSVLEAMLRSFSAYVDRGGDIASTPTSTHDPVIFPSVTRSIIEVQTISLPVWLTYMYPLEIVTIFALVLFACRLALTPVFIWFAPLLVLALLSMEMGARMALFGPPALMLALCTSGGLLLETAARCMRSLLVPRRNSDAGERCAVANPAPCARDQAPCPSRTEAERSPVLCAPNQEREGPRSRESRAAAQTSPAVSGTEDRLAPRRAFAGSLVVALAFTCVLSWPLIMLLPKYTLGPVPSREQAEGLAYLKENSPPDSLIWNWWDWGYATHHFARRKTIADGARHGGPSLYLPAAVYTTADPRFARQIIKYTATRGNIPGNVFTGLSGHEAQQLMRDLSNHDLPLVQAPGRQYLVVSFELLRLGTWITHYGSWNFETQQNAGSHVSVLAAGLTFNMETGILLRQDGQGGPIYTASITFIDSRSLERMHYNRYGALHYIFNTQYLPPNETPSLLRRSAQGVWQKFRPEPFFPAQISDKLAVDEVFYNTMMVQLLLNPPDDPAIAPYFKLVFDNTYTRIYEVL